MCGFVSIPYCVVDVDIIRILLTFYTSSKPSFNVPQTEIRNVLERYKETNTQKYKYTHKHKHKHTHTGGMKRFFSFIIILSMVIV